jgi:hypothetical protein
MYVPHQPRTEAPQETKSSKEGDLVYELGKHVTGQKANVDPSV